MDQNKRQAVALMRYSAIAPLIAGTQESKLRTGRSVIILPALFRNGILPIKTPDLTDCSRRAVLTAVSAGRSTMLLARRSVSSSTHIRAFPRPRSSGS